MATGLWRVALLIACSLVTTTGAQAQEAILPVPDLDVSTIVTVVSDYRFRGISQNNRRPTIQASVDLAHRSGAYLSSWISPIADNGGCNLESQLAAGYSTHLDGFTVDAWGAYYLYPGTKNTNYGEMFVHASRSVGPVEFAGILAYVPAQRSTGHLSNKYIGVELSAPLASTGLAIHGAAGLEDGAFADHKWDWSIGLSGTFKTISVSATYVDTARARSGRNGAGGIVLAASSTF